MLLLQGLALFACIPLVLWLFLAQPLGPAWSMALGLAITHAHVGAAMARLALASEASGKMSSNYRAGRSR